MSISFQTRQFQGIATGLAAMMLLRVAALHVDIRLQPLISPVHGAFTNRNAGAIVSPMQVPYACGVNEKELNLCPSWPLAVRALSGAG
jgi:hypothetical protein